MVMILRWKEKEYLLTIIQILTNLNFILFLCLMNERHIKECKLLVKKWT